MDACFVMSALSEPSIPQPFDFLHHLLKKSFIKVLSIADLAGVTGKRIKSLTSDLD